MKRILRLALLAVVGSAVPAAPPLHAQPEPAEYLARRTGLAGLVGDAVVVVLGTGGATSGDQALGYLTGVDRADAALVVAARDGRHDATLFGDAVAAGPLAVRPLADLDAALDSLLAAHGDLIVIGGFDPEARGAGRAVQRFAAVRARHPQREPRQGGGILGSMRAVKSATELDNIRRAVFITAEAHREVLRNLRPGMNEADVQAIVDDVFRRLGGDERPAFRHIIASAANSTILHYNANNRRIADGEHVKIDIGAAYRGYAADVTRTYPANGVYSPAQREIYQVVRAAQAAAEAVAQLDAPRADMSRAADRVLAEGLTRLGLMDGPDATYECVGRAGATQRCPQLRLFYFHALGHGLGLNVHDAWLDRLVPGTAFVIEPGIYVRTNLMDLIPDVPGNRAYRERIAPAFARYAGIGVRIEDSFIMTASGLERISTAPREIHEIEALMAAQRRD